MCVRQEFDSDGDFKGKVGDEDEVVGKIQNDELLTVQKCFIFPRQIKYLTVMKSIMSIFHQTCAKNQFGHRCRQTLQTATGKPQATAPGTTPAPK